MDQKRLLILFLVSLNNLIREAGAEQSNKATFNQWHNSKIHPRRPRAVSGAGKSLNGREKIRAKKSEERVKDPLGTKSSSKGPELWLLIGARKLLFFLPNHRAARLGVASCLLTRNIHTGQLLAIFV